ncbi:MAG TPA: hypothetical protein VGA37_14675 [Gemmatimonadales bacterium]
MMHRQTVDPDLGIRRFLEDLRSGFDRRGPPDRRRRGRRAAIESVERDRRRAADRRLFDRRRPADRRHLPAREYSEIQIMRIREMLADPFLTAACPGCDAGLLRTERMIRGVARCIVLCTGCRTRAELS